MKSKLRTTLLLALALSALLLSGCAEIYADSIKDTREVVRGSGDVVTQDRAVSDFAPGQGGFDSISLTGFGQVTITQGDEQALSIETDDNLMQYIETQVKNGTLTLGYTDEVRNLNVRPSDGIKFHLSVREVAVLEILGAGDIHAPSLEVERLEVQLKGAGNISVGVLAAKELVVRLKGAGDVEMAGQVVEQDVEISGSGAYRGARLESQMATVEISGAGNVTVWAADTLDAQIPGIGNVEYYGSPSITQKISGLGKLISLGNP